MCTKLFSILLLLLVLFVGLSGSLWGESFSSQLNEVSTQLTEISKQYNEISVNSELTLMDLQEISLQLQQELKAVQKDLDLAMNDLAKVMVLSENNLLRWNNLQNGIDSLSFSVETLGMSLLILEGSVKEQRVKTNIGLGLSIAAVIIGAVALGYSLFRD